ncbi:hypothetical protein PIIN_05245 [Serendipita indica DSM 11827]|uniref:Uncharacterized protein n=1 Tax=Serendipita indica (strain DSM 11827) TaxID=1109443 RepID=G4TJ13_SERID|nr:hypothetical protein PIIN_05245 [Serendipita indica DSM 11827]
MNTRWPEIGSTLELLKAQDADLALAHELMRERARLEQAFLDGLRALVKKHKPESEEDNREYSKVLITAFEQEIEARSKRNSNIPEWPAKKELPVGFQLAKAHHDAQITHDDKYSRLWASKDELKEWLITQFRPNARMPLVELEYRLSVHHQRTSARCLREWYENELPRLMESHHSALEETKATIINTVRDIINCASTLCSQVYSRASGNASNLSPLSHRASLQGKLDVELASHALIPADYYNWFFDGKPSPLLFGIGTLPLDFSGMPNWEPNEADILFYVNLDIPRLLKAEEINGLDSVPSKRVILFELAQYGPLLPLNSQEVDRLFFSSLVAISDSETKTKIWYRENITG